MPKESEITKATMMSGESESSYRIDEVSKSPCIPPNETAKKILATCSSVH